MTRPWDGAGPAMAVLLIFAVFVALFNAFLSFIGTGFADNAFCGLAFFLIPIIATIGLLSLFKSIRFAAWLTSIAFLSQWTVLAISNVNICKHEACTTANPITIAVGSIVAPPLLLSLAVALCVVAAAFMQKRFLATEGI